MANDEENIEESIEGLELETTEESSNEETPNEKNSPNESENEKSDAIIDENSEEFLIQKKQSKIKKILIIVAGVLGAFVLIGIILYFIGVFDPEPIELKPDENTASKSTSAKDTTEVAKGKQGEVLPPEKKKYQFKMKDINKKRLNRKLSLLTKHEIIEDDIIEDEIIKETKKSEVPKEIITNNENKDTLEKVALIEQNVKSDVNSEVNTTKDSEKMQESIPEKKEENTTSDIKIKEEALTHTAVEKKQEVITEIEDTLEKEESSTKVIAKDDNQEITANQTEEEVIKEEENSTKEDLPQVKETETDTEMINEDKTIEIESKQTDEMVNDNIMDVVEEAVENEITKDTPIQEDLLKGKSFLKFAQIATIKQHLYLSFLHQIREIDKRISVCRNDVNIIQIFVGPFDNNKDREEVLNKINQHIVHDAFAIDFTQEEFDKRCNF